MGPAEWGVGGCSRCGCLGKGLVQILGGRWWDGLGISVTVTIVQRLLENPLLER